MFKRRGGLFHSLVMRLRIKYATNMLRIILRFCLTASAIFLAHPSLPDLAAQEPSSVQAPEPLRLAGEPYVPEGPVSGELYFVGSTTMNQLAAVWVDGFHRPPPDVKVSIEYLNWDPATQRILSIDGEPIGTTWGKLGLSDAWGKERITIHSREKQ